ncbi:MAG: hypothetical protein JO336_22520 [Acidobacteriia bacterium]|nr:hypothetical protein [Terriglobia bacterium]
MTTPAPGAVINPKVTDDKLPGERSLMQQQPGDITILLQRLWEGDPAVEQQLYQLVYFDLKKCARNVRRRFSRIHDIETTELIGGVYVRLRGVIAEQDWRNRQHFYAFFARSMQRYMIDYVRRWDKVELTSLDGLEGALPAPPLSPLEMVLVDQWLTKLEAADQDAATVLRMKYFLGLTDQEIAGAMNTPLRTTQRILLDARIWLFTRMGGESAKGAGR